MSLSSIIIWTLIILLLLFIVIVFGAMILRGYLITGSLSGAWAMIFTRQPTPEELQKYLRQAKRELLAAHTLIQQITTTNKSDDVLKKAHLNIQRITKHLERARRLHPTATIEVKDEDGTPYELTVDRATASAFWYEAGLYAEKARNLEERKEMLEFAHALWRDPNSGIVELVARIILFPIVWPITFILHQISMQDFRYKIQDEYCRAASSLEKALNYQPYNRQYKRRLAQFYARSRRWNKAMDLLEKMIESDPQDTETLALHSEIEDDKPFLAVRTPPR